MTKLKRLPTKYVRDRAKSAYNKGTECFVCTTAEELEFHHFYTVSILLNTWIRKNRLDPENILDFRDRFIEEHKTELYDETVTLCKNHHASLHMVYGKNPALGTAPKQKKWVEIQKEKHGAI